MDSECRVGAIANSLLNVYNKTVNYFKNKSLIFWGLLKVNSYLREI